MNDTNFRNALSKGEYAEAMNTLSELLEHDFNSFAPRVFSTKNPKSKKASPLFIKNNNKRLIQAFWNSPIPECFGYNLCTHARKGKEFAREALKKEQAAVAIVKQGLELDPEGLLQLIRQHMVIKNRPLWTLIKKELEQSAEPEIQNFLSQAAILEVVHDELLEEVKRHDSLLNKLKPETIVVSFALFLEKKYFEYSNDRAFEIFKRSLTQILERVLQRKRELISQRRKIPIPKEITYGSTSSFTDAYGKLLKIIIKDSNPDAFSIFESYDRLLDVEFMLYRFSMHKWKVTENPKNQSQDIIPQDPIELRSWNRVNAKYQVIHKYYDLIWQTDVSALENIKSMNAPNVETVQVHQLFYSFLYFASDFIGYSLEHIDKKTPINVEKIFLDVQRFSTCYHAQYCNPMRKRKYDGWSWKRAVSEGVMIDAFEASIQKKGYCEPASVRTIDHMLTTTIQRDSECKLPPSNKKDTELALGLMSEKLNGNNLSAAQFFDVGNRNILIVPRFIETDVRTTTFNSLVKWNHDNNRPLSEYMEKQISQLFMAQGYSTAHSWTFKGNAGTRDGEADVLAYKDGVLFIIEAKLTYFRTSISEIEDHKSKLEEGKNQLSNAMSGIKQNYDEIQNQMNISESLDQLKIIPLLISSTPEYDGSKTFGIRKTNIFDLSLLLDPVRFEQFYKLRIWQETACCFFHDKYPAIDLERETEHNFKAVQSLFANHEEEIYEMIDTDQLQKDIEFLHTASTTPQGLIETLDQDMLWQRLLPQPEAIDEDYRYQSVDLKGGKTARYAF